MGHFKWTYHRDIWPVGWQLKVKPSWEDKHECKCLPAVSNEVIGRCNETQWNAIRNTVKYDIVQWPLVKRQSTEGKMSHTYKTTKVDYWIMTVNKGTNDMIGSGMPPKMSSSEAVPSCEMSFILRCVANQLTKQQTVFTSRLVVDN